MVLKFERFSHLSGRSFGLSPPIEFEALLEFQIDCDESIAKIDRIIAMSKSSNKVIVMRREVRFRLKWRPQLL